jgi:hypothetical protein
MFDDGTHGDESAKDGIYALKFVFTPAVSGENKLDIKAVDRSTWEGRSAAKLFVVTVKQ